MRREDPCGVGLGDAVVLALLLCATFPSAVTLSPSEWPSDAWRVGTVFVSGEPSQCQRDTSEKGKKHP